jgi:glutamate-1-semialdehyde aminotransferase
MQGFLKGLRGITEENSSLLIFDEVITGSGLARAGTGVLQYHA